MQIKIKPVSNYPAKVRILTPTHVGAGSHKNWQNGIDFFYKNGFMYVVDSRKLHKILDETPMRGHKTALDIYTDYLANRKLGKIEDLIREADIDFEEIARFKFEDSTSNPPKEIQTVIRTGRGVPMLPGSSIKGAIRSAVFNYLIREKRIDPRDFDDRTTEKQLLGSFSNDIMRFIRVYDAEIPQTEISLVELFNLYRQGRDWKSDYKDGGLCTVESFVPDATGNFRIDIAAGLLNLIEQGKKRDALPPNMQQIWHSANPIKFLFKIINEHTRRHLRKEIQFFEEYNQAEDSDLIIEKLEEIQTLSQNEDTAILRMSYGSGFHGITGDWRFNDHTSTIERPDHKNKVYSPHTRQRESARYKSRRIADNRDLFACMGFVELSLR